MTSATIDAQRFAAHFSEQGAPAPIIEVSGRTFPVDVRYRPLGAAALLQRNLLIYGVGGIIAPFIGIKFIDVLLTYLRVV